MGKFADAPIHPDVARNVRILDIDIETSPTIVANFGIRKAYLGTHQVLQDERVLCFGARWSGTKRVIFRSEFHDGRDKMLTDVHALLDQADIVRHYNGTSFDVPKLEGELAVEGYAPPAPFKQVDLFHAVKRFGFISHKLGFVAEKFGIGEKMKHEGFDLWLQCLAGDEKAWATMRRYCMRDVTLLEPLADRIRPWHRSHPNMALFVGDDERRCRLCGNDGLEVIKHSKALTDVTAYAVVRCTWCHTPQRSKHRMAAAHYRAVTR
jgi:hypothetical protein